VLLVEDSAAMREFVSAALESNDAGDLDLAVTRAGSGFEALKILPRQRFDLIITDINMPDINGLELVRFLRDSPQHRTTPLFIISTEGRDRDRQKGLALGANEYLVKPFPAEDVVRLARQYLTARRGAAGS
jgi:two-component system chemotaxis response regulator CheY